MSYASSLLRMHVFYHNELPYYYRCTMYWNHLYCFVAKVQSLPVFPTVWVIVSSAYISVSVCNWSGMSFRNIRNRTGPSTEPCGTALLTDWLLDTFNPSTTHWDLFERYDSNQRRDGFLRRTEPIFAEAFHDQQHQKLFWGRKILLQQCSLSIWLSQSFINLISAVWQEWCFRKPDWASCKSLYLFR